MSLPPNYYRDRVCLNVLAGSKENAVDIYEAAEGHVLVGVLSKNYPDIPLPSPTCRPTPSLSTTPFHRAGAGDPRQSAMVAELARQLQPQHVNQVFTGVGASRALLGQADTLVNGLVSPPASPAW